MAAGPGHVPRRGQRVASASKLSLAATRRRWAGAASLLLQGPTSGRSVQVGTKCQRRIRALGASNPAQPRIIAFSSSWDNRPGSAAPSRRVSKSRRFSAWTSSMRCSIVSRVTSLTTVTGWVCPMR